MKNARHHRYRALSRLCVLFISIACFVSNGFVRAEAASPGKQAARRMSLDVNLPGSEPIESHAR